MNYLKFLIYILSSLFLISTSYAFTLECSHPKDPNPFWNRTFKIEDLKVQFLYKGKFENTGRIIKQNNQSIIFSDSYHHQSVSTDLEFNEISEISDAPFRCNCSLSEKSSKIGWRLNRDSLKLDLIYVGDNARGENVGVSRKYFYDIKKNLKKTLTPFIDHEKAVNYCQKKHNLRRDYSKPLEPYSLTDAKNLEEGIYVPKKRHKIADCEIPFESYQNTTLQCKINLASSNSISPLSEKGAANKCSALFFIMTSIQKEEPALGEYFTKQGQMSQMLTGLYWSEETSETITNGMVSDIKSEEIKNYGKRYPSEKGIIQKELENCMGWTYQIGLIVEDNPSVLSDEKKLKKLLLNSPRPNEFYEYPFEDKSWLNEIIIGSFDTWIINGSITPNSMKDLLNAQ